MLAANLGPYGAAQAVAACEAQRTKTPLRPKQPPGKETGQVVCYSVRQWGP